MGRLMAVLLIWLALPAARLADPGPTAPRVQDPKPKVTWQQLSGILLLKFLREGHITLPPPSKEAADPGAGPGTNEQRESQPKQMRIGIIGESPFALAVRKLALRKPAEGPAKVRFQVLSVADVDVLARQEQLAECDVLLLETHKKEIRQQVIRAFAKRPVLLAGSRPDLIHHGAHLEFFLGKDGRVGFELDAKTLIRKHRFKLSAQVVKLSKSVKKHRSPEPSRRTPAGTPRQRERKR